METGKLYICATPIGNLEDVSVRLLKTLRGVDLIACEDTRQSLKLLNRYHIKKPLVSYHQHSSQGREDYIVEQLLAGKKVALISDAGMPGISDPGEELIARAIEQGINLEVIPGPSALVTALTLSGLATSAFLYAGFLPNRSGKRREMLTALKDQPWTVIFYEAPHRLLSTLSDMEEILGPERRVAVGRELTKKHEEVVRGTVGEVKGLFLEKAPRGEITLVVDAAPERPAPAKNIEEIVAETRELIEAGMEKKEALKMKAREYGLKKSSLYRHLVEKDQE